MKFFSPFGPKFLQLQLQDDIRIKLLDCVNQLRQSPSKTIGKWSPNTPEEQDAAQKNSIVDGEMILITPTDQEKHENIIADIITDLIKLYAYKLYEDQETEYEETEYEYLLTDCWYVVLKSGDFHMLHSHKRNDDIFSVGQLAGSIYLDIPENLPHPQGVIEWVFTGATDNLSNSSCEFSPKSGDVVLWPSWLRHHVYPFRSNKERIMISFNGIWGEHMNVKHIKEEYKETD